MNDYRVKLADLLETKAIEGLDILQNTDVSSKDYSQITMNILNTGIERKRLLEQIEFDKQEALVKNKPVDMNDLNEEE